MKDNGSGVHEDEAQPLHAQLRDAEQSSRAFESLKLRAAVGCSP
jgi:hypothetical protein